ncbi:MAG: ATP-binding cassette domain-containing protein, partial [Patulibacter sp.]|nr:ATP-binding cassette domain-containing protein [Patulibacter sp.]
MTPLLRSEGLTVLGGGGEPIIEGVDLALHRGEIVAILGVNGSGKTTLVRALAGLVEPSSGELRLGDRTAVSARRHAAYLPQLARPVPWRDAIGNAALPLEASGVDRRTARKVAREALASTDPALMRRGGRRATGLSGGERQRLLLAGVLAIARPLVLLDEPLSAVDAVERRAAQDRLRQYATSGRCVVLVTHEPTEAARVADRIVVLGGRPGRVVAERVPPPPARRDPELQGLLDKGVASISTRD